MPATSLKARSLTAFLWGGAGSVLKLLIQIGAQIILARLLGPEQYGLFAIGVIVISFSNFLADVGIAYGLIQRQELTDEHIRFVFTWQLFIGLLVSLAVAGLSGPLAEFFKEPRAQQVLLIMAPICFIQAATAVSLNLLKRDLNFKHLQIGQSIGYLVGYVMVGIPLALTGWEVMALIVAWVVQVILTFIILFGRVQHPIRPLIKHQDAISMASFGVKALATNLTNWMISNIDRVVVARSYPSVGVGLYTTPYNLMYTPTTTMMSVIQPVMYSACSKVQGQQERIGNAYLTLVAAICLFPMPVFLSIAAVADTFILAIYGAAWKQAAEVLMPIAFSMPLYMLWNITTPPLWTNGRPGLEFLMQLPLIFVWLVAAIYAAQFSLRAVAWTVFGLILLRLVVFVFATLRITGISITSYLKASQGGLLVSIILVSIAWSMDHSGFESPLVRLFMIILVTAVAGLVLIKTMPRLVFPPLAQLICQRGMSAPGKVGVIVNWYFACTRSKK